MAKQKAILKKKQPRRASKDKTPASASMELSGRVRFDGSLDLRLHGQPLLVAGRPVSPATARLLASSYRLKGNLRRPEVEVEEPR